VSNVTIWHNPRCSKSRATLALLQEQGIEPLVRLYLQDSPSTDEISTALEQLGATAQDLVRKSEEAFAGAGLDRNSPQAELIQAMAAEPILIERPIVFSGGRAAIGRPPEAVLKIL
jgi:arsenate reductase